MGFYSFLLQFTDQQKDWKSYIRSNVGNRSKHSAKNDYLSGKSMQMSRFSQRYLVILILLIYFVLPVGILLTALIRQADLSSLVSTRFMTQLLAFGTREVSAFVQPNPSKHRLICPFISSQVAKQTRVQIIQQDQLASSIKSYLIQPKQMLTTVRQSLMNIIPAAS